MRSDILKTLSPRLSANTVQSTGGKEWDMKEWAGVVKIYETG